MLRLEILDDGLDGIQVAETLPRFLTQWTRIVEVDNQAVVDSMTWKHFVEIVSCVS